MQSSLLTAGQFATLARTTKRTVLWYEKAGILLPASVDERGYRAYEPRQVLDFQIISLLRQLDFSLEEIEQHVSHGKSLMSLFGAKKAAIAQEIARQQRMLRDLEAYHDNLASGKFLVKPDTHKVTGFEIYYIPVKAAYADIPRLCSELAERFVVLPASASFLTIFENQDYRPEGAQLRIAVTKRPGMRLRDDAKLKTASIPDYTALTCHHQGDGSLLSLLWTELGAYRRAHQLEPASHLDFYELEIYHSDTQKTPADGRLDVEMHLPVQAS